MRKVISLILLSVTCNCFAQFKEIELTETAVDVRSVFAADLDNDGDDDILFVSPTDSKIGFYENLGGTNFSKQQIILRDPIDKMWEVIAIDVDGDGDLDPIVGKQNHLTWFENKGNLEFGPQNHITDQIVSCRGLDAADLDNDGDIDLFATSWNGEIFFFENDGNGFSLPPQELANNCSGANDLVLVDTDNDSDLDLLVTSYLDDALSLFENLGGNSFGPKQLIENVNEPYSIISADLDNDLDEDLLVTAFLNGDYFWIENLGGNTFGPKSLIFSTGTATCINTIDIEDDGDLDLLLGGTSLVMTENLGGATFGSNFLLKSDNSSDIKIVDLDNDGMMEVLAAGGADDHIYWYEKNGLGALLNMPVVTDILEDTRNSITYDVDNDGDKDVLACGSFGDENLTYYENLGNNNFKEQHVIDVNNALLVESLFMADLDQDGFGDLLGSSAGGGPNSTNCFVVWFKGNGDGTFGPQQSLTSASYLLQVHAVVAGDLDGDLDNDIIVADIQEDEVFWFENLGGGTFSTEMNISSVADGTNHLILEDLDMDGDLDIVTPLKFSNQIVWYENDGAANFSSEQDIPCSLDGPVNVNAADLNGDGLNDLISCSEFDNKLAWFPNLGGGSFGAQITISTNFNVARNLYTGDIDNDGDNDIIVASKNDDKLSWFENDGSGTFLAEHQINLSSYGGIYGVNADDLDNDGDLDVIANFSDHNKVSVFENDLVKPNQFRGHLFVDLNQNGVKDSTDYGADVVQVIADPNNLYAYSYSGGDYFINIPESDTGWFMIYPDTMANWSITSDSVTYNVHVDSSFIFEDSLDFGFYPDTMIDKADTHLIGGHPRCDDEVNYWLDIHNSGSSMISGIVCLELDNQITYLTASIAPDSIVGQKFYWNLDSMLFLTNQLFNVQVLMPDFNSMGDTLTSLLNVELFDTSGSSTYTTADTLDQFLVCAYDPNDKTVDPVGIDFPGYVPITTEYIDYTIRFQNTGTDTATNVIIDDQIDQNLNWLDIMPLSYSHSMNMEYDNNGNVTFKFMNIMLPDSNVNEPLSHGYLKFRVYIDSNIVAGTSIFNTAEIYFDNNPPIVTNTAITTPYDCQSTMIGVVDSVEICENEMVSFALDHLPSTDSATWTTLGQPTQIGQTFAWIVDTSGVHELSLHVDAGFCTSDTTIVLEIIPELSFQISNQEICTGDSLLIFGNYHATTGFYYDTLQSVLGCDSILGVDLYVSQPFGVDTQVQCDSVQWMDGSTYLSSNNTATHTLLNGASNGCDSIVQLDLTVNYSVSGTDIIASCNEFTWINGASYSTTIQDTFLIAGGSILGCDSTVFLDFVKLDSSESSENILACQSYTWINSTTYFSSVLDTFNIVGGASNGCDSIIYLDLTINNVDNGISEQNNVLTSSTLGAIYSWLDCDNAYAVISGQNGSSFTPSQNGNYAVLVTENGCTDTSQCINVSTIGLNENADFIGIKLYPNPGSGQYILELTDFSTVEIRIYDAFDKLVLEKLVENERVIEFKLEAPPGLYYLKLQIDGERTAIVKLINN